MEGVSLDGLASVIVVVLSLVIVAGLHFQEAVCLT